MLGASVLCAVVWLVATFTLKSFFSGCLLGLFMPLSWVCQSSTDRVPPTGPPRGWLDAEF